MWQQKQNARMQNGKGPAAPRRKTGAVAVLIASIGWNAMNSHAQEVAPYRLTGVDGHVSMRYVRDEYRTGEVTPSSGSAGSYQAFSDLRTEVFLMTHGYVYHPNFLMLDLGGGPVLERSSSVSDGVGTQAQDEFYNFATRGTFFREKPYRGSVFYEHLNPTLNVAPGQVLTQENTRYGFDFSLLSPLTPAPLYVDATRSHTQGRSADRIIDDRIDRLNLRSSWSWGPPGYSEVQYLSTQQESFSGSPDLPVQGSTFDESRFTLDSRFKFGDRRQYDVINLVALDSQQYTLEQSSIPDRTAAQFLLNLIGRHSAQVNSFGSYNYNSSEQGLQTYTLQSGNVGMNYWPTETLALTAGMRADDNRTTEFSSRSQGGDGSVTVRRPLARGIAQLNYGVRYLQFDQQAAAPQTNVIGDRVTLTGTTPVALARPSVVAGSVVVSNDTRTQTFVDGLDYTLTVVGLETRLQRLVGGSIVDGQAVLVDYSYDVGGTYAYNQIDQTLGGSWTLGQYAHLYFRYLDAAPRLTSGQPSSPLNSIQSTVYGARAEAPLGRFSEIALGGDYEYEDRRETISPYRREAYDFYVRTEDPIFGTGNMQLLMRHARVDYDFSAQDVNLVGYDFSLATRHPVGIDLSVNAGYEIDDGAPTIRRRTTAAAKAQWRYRRVVLAVEFLYTRDVQGEFERTRTLGQVLLRRYL